MQIGAAHAASPHAQQHLAGLRVGARYLLNPQRTVFHWLRLVENGGLHATIVAQKAYPLLQAAE